MRRHDDELTIRLEGAKQRMHGAVEDAWADEGLSFSWTLDNFVARRRTKTGRSLR